MLHLTDADDFFRPELISGEVHMLSVGQPIPVVVTGLGILDEDLTEDQLSSEQLLNDQRSHSTLPPSGIFRPPALQVVRVTGVRSPAGSKYRAQYFQVDHVRTSARGTLQ